MVEYISVLPNFLGIIWVFIKFTTLFSSDLKKEIRINFHLLNLAIVNFILFMFATFVIFDWFDLIGMCLWIILSFSSFSSYVETKEKILRQRRS